MQTQFVVGGHRQWWQCQWLYVHFRAWAIYNRGNESRLTRNPRDNGMENAPEGWRAAARQWGRTSVQASWVSDRPWQAARPHPEFRSPYLSLYLSRFTLERVSIVHSHQELSTRLARAALKTVDDIDTW